jgi:hypothetical protein
MPLMYVAISMNAMLLMTKTWLAALLSVRRGRVFVLFFPPPPPDSCPDSSINTSIKVPTNTST